jgi:hypothetical protein
MFDEKVRITMPTFIKIYYQKHSHLIYFKIISGKKFNINDFNNFINTIMDIVFNYITNLQKQHNNNLIIKILNYAYDIFDNFTDEPILYLNQEYSNCIIQLNHYMSNLRHIKLQIQGIYINDISYYTDYKYNLNFPSIKYLPPKNKKKKCSILLDHNLFMWVLCIGWIIYAYLKLS